LFFPSHLSLQFQLAILSLLLPYHLRLRVQLNMQCGQRCPQRITNQAKLCVFCLYKIHLAIKLLAKLHYPFPLSSFLTPLSWHIHSYRLTPYPCHIPYTYTICVVWQANVPFEWATNLQQATTLLWSVHFWGATFYNTANGARK